MAADLNDRSYEDLLREGILAAKNDQRTLARRLLLQATRLRPLDSRPWIWLSQTTDEILERKEFLERAVTADPGDTAARRGLAILSGQLDPQKVLPQGEGVVAREPETPEVAKVFTFSCPNCGGSMQFDVDRQDLICESCGYAEEEEHEPAADIDGQLVDLVLPTVEAHRWAEAQHLLRCDKCGAVTIAETTVRTNRCTYCGSLQLTETEEGEELIDPDSIGLVAIDESEATKRIRDWLKEGMYTPSDLVKEIRTLELRPGYYPFWMFDGTLEVPWNCQVNDGSRNSPNWIPRSGTEHLMFNDILIPGLKNIGIRDLDLLQPFKLKDLVTFKPNYLAGWSSLAYDRSMADASLQARELVMREFQRTVTRRIEPSWEKKDLRVGGGTWSGLTFKHILLPLWIGVYTYEGELYRVVVNGQTGKVAGKKPKDRVTVALVWVAAGIIVLALVLAAIFGALFYGDELAVFIKNLAGG